MIYGNRAEFSRGLLKMFKSVNNGALLRSGSS